MKPILFNTVMVQAILEGIKTTTRRVVKDVDYNYTYLGSDKQKTNVSFVRNTTGLPLKVKIPYKVGDILYVKETWLKADDGKYYFRANETPVSKEAREDFGYKWHPSLHMPKVAARIFLKVTDVKVERLQDMKFSDLRKEGITPDKEYEGFKNAVEANLEVKFATLWDSTVNKKDIDQYGFIANPWVWVIEFERIEKSEVKQLC